MKIAQYKGWCASCNERITPGDRIAKRKIGWVHWTCRIERPGMTYSEYQRTESNGQMTFGF